MSSTSPVRLFLHADDVHGTAFDSLYEAQAELPQDPDSRIVALDDARTLLAVSCVDRVGWAFTQAGTRRISAELTGGVKTAGAVSWDAELGKVAS